MHQGVEFVDFAVGYGDAAVGPVAAQVLRADGAEAVFEAVDLMSPPGLLPCAAARARSASFG